VIVPVLVLAVLAAVIALLEAAESPPWLAWLPAGLAPAIAAALAVVVLWWAEPWATRRAASSATERTAVDRLRSHLGRQQTLAQIRAVDPLALRVHPSVATVKAHISHILTKLGLSNRTQIALLGHDSDRAGPT
jgi:hypothetical protein